MRNSPEHKGRGWDQQPGKRPLGSGGKGDGDAEQDDALPVPENDFARRIQGVRGGDGGEDEAEGSPGGKDLRPGKRGARNHSGAEGKEREHDVAGSRSVEAARNIPEREREAESGEQEGRANEPAMLVEPELIEQKRILRQMKKNSGDRKQWNQRRGDRLGWRGM